MMAPDTAIMRRYYAVIVYAAIVITYKRGEECERSNERANPIG